MTGPHVLVPSQVLVPVVLLSQLASTPTADTPASVCCLTQRDTVSGKKFTIGEYDVIKHHFTQPHVT